jgi:hypothetical protein
VRNLVIAVASLLAVACASSKAAAPTAAPAPTPVEVKPTGVPGEAGALQTEKASAKVTAVDAAKRTLTIQEADGSVETITVGPEVKRFSEIAVGDTIVVEFERGLLLAYQAAGSESVEPHAVAVGGRAAPGEQPGGVVAAAVQGTVTVTAIDMGTRVVTFQGPGGRSYGVKAGRDVQLEKLKVGDRLLATYAEAMAITLEKVAPK